MRTLLIAALVGVAALFFGSGAGQARDLGTQSVGQGKVTPDVSAPPSITMRVSAGYQGVYRDTAWAPVRVSLHNGTSADVSGTLRIPQSGAVASVGASLAFHGLYQAPVTLPAGGTKQVTVYVPGSGIQGEVDVRFDQGTRTLVASSTYPVGIDTSALLIGVMTSSPRDTGWIAPAIQQNVTTHVLRLDAQTLDPVPDALATFDLVVLSDVDASQLDSAQIAALKRYVRNGGSLMLVGGPSWQQTLRPLAPLLPGKLTGMRILPDLHGLLALGPMSSSGGVPSGPHRPASGGKGRGRLGRSGRIRPRGYPAPTGRATINKQGAIGTQTAAVSVLSHPAGSVLASQAGIPLVVRQIIGQGAVEYLAFDPSLNPVQSWNGSQPLLQHLVAIAAPLAISRTWSPSGFRARFRHASTTMAITGELLNLPASIMPLLAIFAVLTLAYVVVLGPANFLVLRWVGRQNLAVITIPVLALSYLGSSFGVALHFKGATTVLNSIGVVTLDGAGPHPATFYLGLEAPLPGDYHVTFDAAALPAPVAQLSHFSGFFGSGSTTLSSSPLGATLQEGNQTEVTFNAMQRWSMRDVALNTTVRIPGTVQSDLRVDAQGNLVGPIHNGTNLALLNPVIVAGQSVANLPNVPVGGTVRARVQPSNNTPGGQSSVWDNLYGGPDLGGFDGFFHRFGDCCDQSSFPHETTLLDRVRNAEAVLAQVQTFSNLGDVVLVGWSKQPLVPVRVDGSVPQRRDLTLVAIPLPVRFPSHEPFQLLPGTVPAHLVDMAPQAPGSNGGGFFSRGNQPVAIGAGGSLTFEFDLPSSPRATVRFRRLELDVTTDDTGTVPGRVYDWSARRWASVDLSSGSADLRDPNRFVSPNGRLLLEVVATSGSGDITIDDPSQDVQISGAGTALGRTAS